MVMFLLAGIVILFTVAIIIFFANGMNAQNINEKEVVEDLKKRVAELDADNFDVNSNSKTAKIVVPDAVDVDDSTRVSTQNEECKVYDVNPNQKIEKIVVGSGEKEKVFENTEIEVDEPIKENDSFISKILKDKKDE